MTATVLVFQNKIQTDTSFKTTLLLISITVSTKHNMQIIRVIPFIKLQNTLKQQLNSEKRWKMRRKAKN